MKVSDLIEQLAPYTDFEINPVLRLDVEDDVLDKRSYKFPHDNFGAKIEVGDASYSDNVLLLDITLEEESIKNTDRE